MALQNVSVQMRGKMLHIAVSVSNAYTRHERSRCLCRATFSCQEWNSLTLSTVAAPGPWAFGALRSTGELVRCYCPAQGTNRQSACEIMR
jgi:hypothetical protein